ncbi:MAG: SIMPL domain-containing protein [Rudaea sp.]
MNIKRFLIVGVSAAIVGGAFMLAGGANAAPPQQTTATPTPATAPTTDIGVTGEGKAFAKPDTAIASVGVDVTASTLASASQDASTRMTAVVDKIKSMGVDEKDIKTVSYNINPITSSPKENETPRITGYHVMNVVEIKIRKIDDVGKIMDAAIAAGANSINSLYFTIDDPSAFEKQARTQAVQDAMAKAQTLADAAKVKLGPIISINEGVSRPLPVYDRALAAPSAASGIGPVQTGQNEISVSVEMHFQIIQ